MEEEDNIVFFDSVEAEEHFLQGRTSTPTSTRRLSAAGKATNLKKKNLIPPLHTPSDRRVSLPRASKATPPPTMPTTDKRKAQPPRCGEVDEQPARQELTASEKFIAEQLASLTAMIGGVKEEIGQAESRTAAKIDSKVDDLASKLDVRMSKAESDLSRLATELASTREQLAAVKIASEEREKTLPELVESLLKARPDTAGAISVRAGRRHRPLNQLVDSGATQLEPNRATNEENYWRARKTLRVWPIEGDDLKSAVIDFLENKLKCPAGRVAASDFEAKRVYSPPDTQAQNQVLVTFTSVSLWDEVKSMSRNLSGSDRRTGVQIEPPDHLKGHYQAFQRLAFQLKRKNPNLRRNVKFYDPEACLIMDLKVATEWKSVSYEHAKEILKKTRIRTGSFSIEELETMAEVTPRDLKKRRRDTVDSDSDEDMDSTVIDLTQNADDDVNKRKKNSRRLCFMNTNARSLEPKIRSLYDCFAEKELDFAVLTETWYQNNRELQGKLSEYVDRFALQSIVRNRSAAAPNGRVYGGVALVYRKKQAAFDNFPLINPHDFEVLATVGRVTGIAGKIFCLAVYAPPNLTQSRAKALIEYVSDVIGEAKRTIENCTIVVSGDFN